MTPELPIQISVIVATCNRATELPRLFDALRQQTLSGKVGWELVLVDNRSTDRTPDVVRALTADCPFHLTSLREDRQGKSYALNSGIGVSRGSILAFTDDDGVPAPDWLERIYQIYSEESSIECLGGRVELFDPSDAPVTIKRTSSRQRVDGSSFDIWNIPILGCNMSLRASVFREVGKYDVGLGPGSKAGVAEDLDMLYRIVSAGKMIHYDPTVVVLHNHGRKTDDQVKRVLSGYTQGRGAFYCKHILLRDARVARHLFWELRTHAARWLEAGVTTRRAGRVIEEIRLLVIGAWRYWHHA